MTTKIMVGQFSKGLRNDVTAFNVDNDSFPTLTNAYQWRQRIKRKRGTQSFTRFSRFFNSLNTNYFYNPGNTSFELDSGEGNLLTGFTDLTTIGYPSLVPGTIKINDETATLTYTDDSDGNLVISPSPTVLGYVNYATGSFIIIGAASDIVDARFSYFPGLPSLGLEPFVQDSSTFPLELGFDQTYAYNILLSQTSSVPESPYLSYSVSFYNNLPTSGGYTQKTLFTPVNWNLQNYQQMWTTNYAGALWAVPGIDSPFSGNSVGMQFKLCASVTYASPISLTITITEMQESLVKGDWVFINEVTSSNDMTTGVPYAVTVNLQTGYVSTDPTNDGTTTTLTVVFPTATIADQTYGAGMLQYLTNTAYPTKDCIRWYNGAPTSIPPSSTRIFGKGWVNFMPPLSLSAFGVGDLPPKQYYLVGSRMVVPFKDRLLFFGPIVQTSNGSPIYLQDSVIYSQDGTPYYTASFPASTSPPLYPPLTGIAYTSQLVPANQTGTPVSFIGDAFGYGGESTPGYARPITSVSINEDALIVGLSDRQARLLFTGNDVNPFNFYIINSELGSDSTFSTITLDRGVLSMGGRGLILTSQIASQRIDLEIPNEIFSTDLLNQGAFRVCSQRDFQNEWVYFSYPSNQSGVSIYPDTTLQYNYREQTWGLFYESYTTYGTVRVVTGDTWLTWTNPWGTYTDPWTSGQTTLEQPQVIGGNGQGFVLIRGVGTDEGYSLFIQSIDGSEITSPNHNLNENDYIVINNCIGTVGTQINGKIFQVTDVTQDTFNVFPPIQGSWTYTGKGLITRLYIPLIQTRQFPTAWELGRKTRLGAQQYLLTKTDNSQITLYIYLSQDSATAYNAGLLVPSDEATNGSLIYSTVLYTCPESINLGLTPFNVNLQMTQDNTFGSSGSLQIWHRVNTSLIGDTVQLGLTLGFDEMTSYITTGPQFTITGATNANPCVLTCVNDLEEGDLVQITQVVGMTQLNFISPYSTPNPPPGSYNYYQVISSDGSALAINIDSTSFGEYVSGGIVQQVYNPDPTAEIELHSFVINISPSQLLA